jgi:serine/threonine protein kinase
MEAPFKPGDVFAQRYAIREVLGPGPVGHVFRAHDQEMDVEVALKIISPRLVQMPEERTQFSLALRAGKKLTHPHLVRVYEEGEEKGRPFITTQLLEGTTLRRMMEQRAARGQRFTLQEVEPLLAQITDALDSAHKFGPHSDLKPENVIVLPDMVKVTDYGLALGIPRLPFIQAQKGWRVGSYVAPEYVEGSEIDTRMDLYALGVLLGELLTGKTPDEGELPELLAHAPELPPGLESLYRRATNTNPLARPKSAGEFLGELSALLSRSRPGAPAAPRPRPKQLPISLTAELALGSKLGPGLALPPVPTAELPALAAPTVLMPAMGSPTQEAERVTLETPRSTLEAPVSGTPTLEMPRHEGDKAPLPDTTQPLDRAPLPDATQPLDSESLARLMGRPKPAAPSPISKSRPPVAPAPAPAARAEPRPAAQATPGRPVSKAAPALPPAPSKRPARSSASLVLLALAGLVLGGVGGYGLLWKLRHSSGGEPSVAEPRGVEPSAAVALANGCPAGMRLVSGGTFKKGADNADRGPGELPLTSTEVASFCIDEFEFPNQPGAAPRVNVTWSEAKRECETLGKRLCVEDEWEKACKGPGNARFPYGSDFDPNKCNTAGSSSAPLGVAGGFEGCRSGYGVADLSGNAAEWTDTYFGTTRERVQKGGASNQPGDAVHCAARKKGDPESRSPSVGFRCCAGVKP